MRSMAIKATVLAVVLLAGIWAVPSFASQPEESYSFSTDDFFGGEGGSYLGVDTRNITPERMAQLHLKEEQGVEVTMVDQDAPAGKAGIKERDVIMSINSQPVESVEQLRRLIREVPPGRTITIGVLRDGQSMTLKAQLISRAQSAAVVLPKVKEFKFNVPEVHVPDFDVPMTVVVVQSSARSGLMVEGLTPQLGEFLGVRGGQGVLVRSVEKGSRAEQAGFRAGDVIVKVNDAAVNDPGDFTHALRSRSGNSLSISIIRDKKPQTLTLSMPDKKESGEMEEESFEIPEIHAEARMRLGDLKTIQPQIMMYADKLRQMQPEIQQQVQELQREQKEFQIKTMAKTRELQKELVEKQKEMRMKIEKDTEHLKDRLRFHPQADI